jgi:hypothetical protein
MQWVCMSRQMCCSDGTREFASGTKWRKSVAHAFDGLRVGGYMKILVNV